MAADKTPEIVFLDWEFTDLGKVGEQCFPLSLGMATASGKSLYLEFVELGPCSQFVREQVIPLMALTERVTVEVARRRILEWLTTCGSPLIFAFDSEYDLRMLDWILPDLRQLLRVHCVKITDDPTLGLFVVEMSSHGRLRQDLDDEIAAWFLRHGLPRHHALHDATAMRDAWLSIRGR